MDALVSRLGSRRVRQIATAGTVTALAFLTSAGPASADVTTVGGGAYGVSSAVTAPAPVGQITTVPTPSVTLPPAGGGPLTTTIRSATVPGLLTTGVITVSTAGGTTVSHLRTAQSTSTVDGADLGDGTVSATTVSSRCASNGNGSAGATTLSGVTGLPGASSQPAPNTVVQVNGLGPVTLNEQTVVNQRGSRTEIVVNAIHVRLTPGTVATSDDIIIGQSRCAAFGPDVLTTAGAGPTVPGAGALPDLPRTGADLWQPTLAGGGLLVVGLYVLLRSRRQRRLVLG